MTPTLSAEQTEPSLSGEFSGYSAGIVTFMDGENYGCDLQRCAMLRALKRFGLRALLIDYAPPRPGARFGFGGRIARALRPAALAKRALSFLDRRGAVFRRFGEEELEKTEPIGAYEDLPRRASFDVFVAGSDQIWNPSLTRGEGGRRFFFLDFAPAGKKISYAPSLGVSEIEPSYAGRIKKSLETFEWISVREREGAEALRAVLGRPVDVVLDPTMLLAPAEWDALADRAESLPILKKEYILCYSLGNIRGVLAAARRLRKAFGARIAPICYSPLDALRLKSLCPECRPVLNAGPAEFVSLIRSAACVVTDSFHGTVFSILYSRPFRTMMRDRRGGASSMNSRIRTLLETFGLEDRLFDPAETSLGAVDELNRAEIDETLSRLREDSLKKLELGLRKVLTDAKPGH